MDLLTLNKKAEPRPLMPLRIPHGWLIQHNGFHEMTQEEIDSMSVHAIYLVEDLLWIEQSPQATFGSHSDWPARLSFDLGWYPDGDSEGLFRLVASTVPNASAPNTFIPNTPQPTTPNEPTHIASYESRDPAHICAKLEQWLTVLSKQHLKEALQVIQSSK